MNKLASIIATCLIASASQATEYKGKEAALTLSFDNGKEICSGTAVGTHTFLSAQHCFDTTYEQLVVNNRLVVVKSVVKDAHDHVLVETDVSFSNVAKLNTKPLHDGQDVHLWGNPDGMKMMFRKGYYVGTTDDGHLTFDMNTWFGDSGGGILNDAGEVVAVETQDFADFRLRISDHGIEGEYFSLSSAIPIYFTPAQMAAIR